MQVLRVCSVRCSLRIVSGWSSWQSWASWRFWEEKRGVEREWCWGGCYDHTRSPTVTDRQNSKKKKGTGLSFAKKKDALFLPEETNPAFLCGSNGIKPTVFEGFTKYGISQDTVQSYHTNLFLEYAPSCTEQDLFHSQGHQWQQFSKSFRRRWKSQILMS